jgi:hypothetical protein
MTNADLNVSFEPPGGAWQRNNNLRDKMPVALLAFQRGDDAWFAIDARDFKDHDPTPKELDDEARARLSGYFQNVDTEPVRGAALVTGDPIAGKPTHVVVFQGELDGQRIAGEVHAFRYEGVGYWFYTWKSGTVDSRHDPDFPVVRKRLALLGERAKWKELEKRRQAFTGTKGKGYSLTDATGRWQPEPESELEGHDPAADLVLYAPDPKQPKLRAHGVFLIVMSIPKADDAVVAAKAHVLAKQKRDSYDMTKIADGYEDGGGPKELPGSPGSKLLRWRVVNTEDLQQFAMVGVVPRPKDVLLLYAQCPWERRHTWEGQLQAIMETLQVQE